MAFYEQLAADRFAPGPYTATSPVERMLLLADSAGGTGANLDFDRHLFINIGDQHVARNGSVFQSGRSHASRLRVRS